MSQDHPTTETANKPPRGFSWRAGLLVLLTILVVYVLSPGPLTWLGCQGYISPSMLTALGIFYRPLFWIVDHTGTFGLLNWYIEFWVDLDSWLDPGLTF